MTAEKYAQGWTHQRGQIRPMSTAERVGLTRMPPDPHGRWPMLREALKYLLAVVGILAAAIGLAFLARRCGL